MSIVKGLILVFIFSCLLYKNFVQRRENKEQRDYFIKTLGHDFRVATLAQIRGLELLNKKAQFCDEQIELITEINNSCKKMLDMISALIHTYQFENGEHFLNFECFSLKDIVKIAEAKVENFLKDKNLVLYSDINSMHFLEADKNLFFNLMINLLTTAINYSEKNNSIVVTSLLEKECQVISIKYSGKPLSEEECKRMFLKDTTFSTVGHGIKMHLCKKIVDFHKGTILVQNCSNNLNSFIITLPLRQKTVTTKSSLNRQLQLN